MQNKKVILDTNLWISFLISNNYTFLDNFIETKKIQLVFSNELFTEFIAVTQRPKFKKFFTPKDLNKLIKFIEIYGVLYPVSSNVEKCRDRKDNFLLNLAIDSSADFLLTGDRDLLDIATIGKTKIVTITDFMNKYLI